MSIPPVLFFRADLPTRTAVQEAARAAGTTVSGWLREAARMRLPDGGTSLPPLPPSPIRRPVRIPSDDVAAVARLIGEVGKLTGATIQLARSLRETGRVSEHAAAETILRDLRSTQSCYVDIVGRLLAAESVE